MAETGVNTCPTCSGSGYVNGVICTSCYGAGTLPLQGVSAHLEARFFDIVSTQAKQTNKLNRIQKGINALLEVNKLEIKIDDEISVDG